MRPEKKQFGFPALRRVKAFGRFYFGFASGMVRGFRHPNRRQGPVVSRQIALTRAALSTCGRTKGKFLSVYQLLLAGEGPGRWPEPCGSAQEPEIQGAVVHLERRRLEVP